jgi:hypothetical protein
MATQTLKMTIQMRRDTTENWTTNKDVVPAAGEPCYDINARTLKIGDGITSYELLPAIHSGEIAPTATHYEGVREGAETDMEVIARVLKDVENATVKDDIFVVKTLIANDKYSHTAYVYNGTKWVAMDGNYNAENVYFDEDFTFTTKIGTVQTLTNGSTTKAAAGKNIKEFLASLFAAEANPSKTDPSVSITLTNSGAHEVGTVLNPTYTATFEDGKYSYGPEPTGATVESWAVTSNYGENWTTATGNCEELTVADDTNYTITAKATHTAGSVPKTNIGNDCTDSTKQIAAGTKSKTSSAITGYRSYFYGVLNTSTADAPLTSAIIREQLTNGGNYNEAKSFTLNGSATAKRIVVAIPSNSTRGGISEVILTSAMSTPVTDSYAKTAKAVKVEGKDGFTAVDYDVYVYEPSKIDAGEVHDIKLA